MQVQNILQQIFQETPEEETTSADLSPLNDAQWAFFQQLTSQPRWTLEAAEALAKSLGLMLMGTLEIINNITLPNIPIIRFDVDGYSGNY